MDETLGWLLVGSAIVLVAASAVRPDVWAAWLHERMDPWLDRLHHR